MAARSASVAEPELHTIGDSYLEFLSEQIELEPRGPAWTQILKSRLDAFERTVGEPLVRIAVVRDGVTFVGHLRASTLDVVHAESI